MKQVNNFEEIETKLLNVPVFIEFIFFNQVAERRDGRRNFNVVFLPWQFMPHRMDTVRITSSITLNKRWKIIENLKSQMPLEIYRIIQLAHVSLKLHVALSPFGSSGRFRLLLQLDWRLLTFALQTDNTLAALGKFIESFGHFL